MTIKKSMRNGLIGSAGVMISALSPVQASGVNVEGESASALESLLSSSETVTQSTSTPATQSTSTPVTQSIRVPVTRGEPASEILRRNSQVYSAIENDYSSVRDYLIENGCPAFLEDSQGRYIEFDLDGTSLTGHRNNYDYNVNIDPLTEQEIGCGSLTRVSTAQPSRTTQEVSEPESVTAPVESSQQVTPGIDSYSLPLRSGNGSTLPSVYNSQNGIAKDVSDISAENDWIPSFSRFGEYQANPEQLAAQLLMNNMSTQPQRVLESRVFSRGVEKRLGIEGLQSFLQNEVDFDQLVTDESCFGQSGCSKLTLEELSNAGFNEGIYRTVGDNIIESSNAGDHSLAYLTDLAQEDAFSKGLRVVGWVLPFNSARGYQTGFTELKENTAFENAREDTLNNCVTQYSSNPKNVFACSYNKANSTVRDNLGGQN